jgi:hypothetical protein
LLDSISVAFFVGPKICIPLMRNWSVMPSASGASGPTTVRSILFSWAILASPSISVGFISRFWASLAVPALPGAT